VSRSHLLLSRACSHNSHRLLSAEYRTLGVIGVGTVPAAIGPVSVGTGDDNGSAGHGSSGSTNLSGPRGSRVSTRDKLTHDFVFSDIVETYCTA